MEQDYSFVTLLSVLKTDMRDWFYTKLELLELEFLEKTSSIGSFLVYGLIIVHLIFFSLLFAFVVLGFLLGEWIGNIVGGFAIVTSIYLALLIFMIVCRKFVLNCLTNLFLKKLDPDLEDEETYKAKLETKKNKR